MMTFAVLLLAHLLGDFPLQTNRVFRMKLASKRGLALHIGIHLIAAAVLIENWWQQWQLLLILGVVHFFTDYVKIRLQKPGHPLTPGFIWDQVAHIVAIGLLALWRPDINSILPMWMLVVATFFAVFPAVMMLLWVWANDHYLDKTAVVSEPIVWISQNVLPISQRLGWGIMAGLFLYKLVLG